MSENKIIIEMADFRHKCVRCGKKADLERNSEHYCFRCHGQLWGSFRGDLKFRFGKEVFPESTMPFTSLMAQSLRGETTTGVGVGGEEALGGVAAEPKKEAEG